MGWSPKWLVSVSLLLCGMQLCQGQIVWNGPPISFTKPGFIDWTLPQNQDRITDLVWITRANTEGLFNIKVETSYTHDLSPASTEWAYGKAADFATLDFLDWETWTQNRPPDTVGKDAVLHLVTEDIYIDIKFTAWGGSPNGGSFSYIRSTVPEPGISALLGLGMCPLIGCRRRR